MAEEQSSLHIDTDWKKQAQEEKRRLAEQEQKKAVEQPAAGGASPRRAAGGRREVPPANFATLVQSLVTQALFYLGELAPQGGEPVINLDMAKHQIDTLSMLEEKTRNNLSDEEKHMLDAALYEARMRYVNVASQFT